MPIFDAYLYLTFDANNTFEWSLPYVPYMYDVPSILILMTHQPFYYDELLMDVFQFLLDDMLSDTIIFVCYHLDYIMCTHIFKGYIWRSAVCEYHFNLYVYQYTNYILYVLYDLVFYPDVILNIVTSGSLWTTGYLWIVVQVHRQPVR